MEENYNFSTGGSTEYNVTVMQEDGHWYDGIVNLWNKSKGWFALVGIGALLGAIIRVLTILLV